MKHFNPRSPHGERRPRMVASSAARNFNPRSPHGERPLNAYGITETKAFQSTLPARGATYRAKTTAARMKHFNPRSPHGERLHGRAGEPHRHRHFNPRSPHGERLNQAGQPGGKKISIHAPRTGSDLAVEISSIVSDISIHAPRTGSDKIKKGARNGAGISIHAPRTGSDTLVWS